MDQLRHRAAADRAYHYLVEHFFDHEHGGVFWELDAEGRPCNTKKQVYAQAFTIYSLTAYHALTGLREAMDYALSFFELMEKLTRDRKAGGYLEAFTREWGELDDLRLSDKDLNFPKTMNTHLHVIEAYTALYEQTPTAEVESALRHLLECFDKRIIDPENFHQRMFMTEDWADHSAGLSYGHDIECSWLLHKALKALKNPEVNTQLMPSVLGLASACLREGLSARGDLMDAWDFATRRHHHASIWWVQAEALVGFINTYALTGDDKYLAAAERLWDFIRQHHVDGEHGEWLWLSRLDDGYQDHYKAGFWKGPYHNGRAMLESCKILNSL
jgi:mannobiose 2-epimerase